MWLRDLLLEQPPPDVASAEGRTRRRGRPAPTLPPLGAHPRACLCGCAQDRGLHNGQAVSGARRQEPAPRPLAFSATNVALDSRVRAEMTRSPPGPQRDAVMLTSLLVWRTEGWDPGGRILRGAPTERLCPCGSCRDCGRSRGCCPEPYRGRGSWEPGSGIVSCWTMGTVRRRNGCWGEGPKPLPTHAPKNKHVTLRILISKGLRRGQHTERSRSSTECGGGARGLHAHGGGGPSLGETAELSRAESRRHPGHPARATAPLQAPSASCSRPTKPH